MKPARHNPGQMLLLPILAEVTPMGGGEYRVKPVPASLGAEQWIKTSAAAKIMGVSQDYIGMLCRENKAPFRTRRVYRLWQVELISLMQFLRTSEEGS